jgi:hypothetical protein
VRRLALALVASALLAGCASPPLRHTEIVWVTVDRIYSPADMQKSWNTGLAALAKGAGLTDEDIAAGRLLRVLCGLGTDYAWGSYAYLPPGMSTRKNEVLELRIEDPTEGSRLGWNPVVGRAERFKFPGASRAYAYIPDWKERGLQTNLEPLPLEPEQRGRYEIAYSEYIIKCRQGDRYR